MEEESDFMNIEEDDDWEEEDFDEEDWEEEEEE